MTNQEFISYAKFKVLQWLWHNVDDMDGISDDDIFFISSDDIFVVWYAKTLQNHKALLGTRFANHYFECTFNGDKGEMYMDIYSKLENKCFKVTD